MTEIKPIYYSDKAHKYYFNNINAFGSYWATAVYNGEALKGGEIKVDKNGRKYIMGRIEKEFSKDGRVYYKCLGFYIPPEDKEDHTACLSSHE